MVVLETALVAHTGCMGFFVVVFFVLNLTETDNRWTRDGSWQGPNCPFFFVQRCSAEQ